jgi:hypothetical protein
LLPILDSVSVSFASLIVISSLQRVGFEFLTSVATTANLGAGLAEPSTHSFFDRLDGLPMVFGHPAIRGNFLR